MKYSFVLLAIAGVLTTTIAFSAQPPDIAADTVRTRTYKHRRYELAASQGFPVYRSVITTTKIPNKGITFETRYFFSKSDTDAIKELTIENLESEFLSNSRFHYALEQEFGGKMTITAWDSFERMYKVQYLYLQSTAAAKK
jgi:hypothetical protein